MTSDLITEIPSISEIEALALKLYDIEAVRFGRFRLNNGRQSPVLIDLRLIVSYPQVLQLVARQYAHVINRLSFDVLAAYPQAGLVLGVAVSLEMGEPLIYPRKTSKFSRSGKQIEGIWEVGQQAVLIEDLITSGKSILEAMATMKAAGLQVRDAVVLIDRQQEEARLLTQSGYMVHSIMTLPKMLDILEMHGRISTERRMGILQMLGLYG